MACTWTGCLPQGKNAASPRGHLEGAEEKPAADFLCLSRTSNSAYSTCFPVKDVWFHFGYKCESHLKTQSKSVIMRRICKEYRNLLF